jgi:hypothetical protein
MISAVRPSVASDSSSFRCSGRRFGSSFSTGRKTEISGASSPAPAAPETPVNVASSDSAAPDGRLMTVSSSS